jgi:glycosyltransferase involved in cell wall biosynthesis
MKMACFTPLPPIQSGISDYSLDLFPYLQRYLDIDIFIDDYTPPEALQKQFNIYPHREFEKRYETGIYDIVLYQMGNNPYHYYMYPYLLKYAGITVLHDYVLHHFIGGKTWLAGDSKGFAEELEYNYGQMGNEFYGRFERGIGTELEKFVFPLNKRVIDSSMGIIVHNNFVKTEIQRANPLLPVIKINMGIPKMQASWTDKANIKEKLGIPPHHFVIGIFGFVTPIKNVHLAVKALRQLQQTVPYCTMVIVGDVQDSRVSKLVDDLHLSKSVRILGYVPEKEFHNYILASDAAINLRYPTAGETSASLLRIMGMGVPVIVFNYRQFAEIPDDCCLKIDLGDHEEQELTAALLQLAIKRDLGNSIGEKAREYVQNSCSLEDAARRYSDFIEKLQTRRAITNAASAVLSELSANPAELLERTELPRVLIELMFP